MAEVAGTQRGKQYIVTVESLADVGALVDLSPEGWGTAGSTQGCNGALEPYQKYDIGDWVLVRAATSYLFCIGKGTVTAKVAVLVGTLSAGAAASLVGAALKYVVYPTAPGFVNPPTGVFTSIAAAITASTEQAAGTNVLILLAPGTHNVGPATLSLNNGVQLVGLGDAPSATRIVGPGGVVPAVTTPPGSIAGTRVSFTNLEIDSNGAPIALAYDDTGAPTGDTFVQASRLSVIGNVSGAGVNVVPTFSAKDSTLANDLLLTASGGSADLTDTLVSGTTSVAGGMASNGAELASVTCNGALSARGSTRFAGTLNVDGNCTLVHCIVAADSSFSNGLTARHTSFAETVSLTSGAPATATLLENCYIATTAGDGLAVSGNDVATLVNTTIRANSGIACSGAGAVVIVGSLPGDGRVTTTTVTAESAQIARKPTAPSPFALTGGGATNAWPQNADWVQALPPANPAVNNNLELPLSSEQVPGRELIATNASATISMRLVPAGADTLRNGTVLGPITLAPGVTRRVMCIRGTGWRVT